MRSTNPARRPCKPVEGGSASSGECSKARTGVVCEIHDSRGHQVSRRRDLSRDSLQLMRSNDWLRRELTIVMVVRYYYCIDILG